jgi:hypothetical protein
VVGEDAATTVGGFFPHVTDYGVWFLDAQINTVEDVHNPGEQTLNYTGNLGLGFRKLDVPNNQVLGLSFWYDLDHTRPDFVHQVSVAMEVLQDRWSLRSNLYFPVGSNRVTTAETPLGAPFYLGENILFPQTRYESVSMVGADVELGRRLPGWLGDNGVSLYGGFYYYDADKSFHTVGGEARLEALVSPALTVDCKYTSDHIFKNTVDVDITWALSFVRCKSCCSTPDAFYRMTEPVVRNRNVVFGTQVVNSPVVATDPNTGQPIVVVHVDSNAAAPGNGTYAMPYTSLPLAQAGSAPNDIILVDAGSTFNGQGITLQNNQRFLGEGIPHTVNTVQAGTILLPPPTGGSALPIINNSPGDAVTLASNNEVSGFVINNPTGSAIAGTGITGTANINNNQLNGGANGINIQNSGANVTVSNTPIVGAATGINLVNNTGTFSDPGTQTISGSTVNGINATGDSGAIAFGPTTIAAASGQGVQIASGTGSTTFGSATTISGTTTNGINVSAETGQTMFGQVGITATSGAGINVHGGMGNASFTGPVTVGGTTTGGILVNGETGQTTFGQVAITAPSGPGIDLESSSLVSIAGGTIAASHGDGFDANNSALAVNLTSVSSTSGTNGIELQNTTGTFAVTGTGTTAGSGGTIMNSGTDGVSLNNAAGVTISNLSIISPNQNGVEVQNTAMANTIALNNIQIGNGTANSGGQKGLYAHTNAGTVNASNIAVTNANTGIEIDSNPGATNFSGTNTVANGNVGIQVTNNNGATTFTGTTGITGTVNQGVAVDNNVGATSFAQLNVAATGGTGLESQNSPGGLTISAGSVSSGTGAGVAIKNEAVDVNLTIVSSGGDTNGIVLDTITGNFAVTGTGTTAGSGGTIANSSGTGILVQNSNANVTLNDMNVTNSSGESVVVKGMTGGTTTINNASITGGTTGLDLSNNAGITFNLANDSIASAPTGINLASDSGGSINFTGTTSVTGASTDGVKINTVSSPINFATLNIGSTGGTGLLMSGSSGLLTIGAGSINNTNGNAIDINGAALAVTLQNVSATNPTEGISLVNTSGFFTATGGTISNASDNGVLLNGTSNVSLSNFNIGSVGNAGIFAENSTGLSLTSNTINVPNAFSSGMLIESAFGTNNISSNNITFAGLPGIYFFGETGGTFTVNNNTFNTASTGFVDGLYIYATVAAATNSYGISGNTFNMTTAPSDPGAAAISVFQDVAGTTNLSSTAVNVVHVTPPYPPFQSGTAGGGVISGTINVNGTPEP